MELKNDELKLQNLIAKPAVRMQERFLGLDSGSGTAKATALWSVTSISTKLRTSREKPDESTV